VLVPVTVAVPVTVTVTIAVIVAGRRGVDTTAISGAGEADATIRYADGRGARVLTERVGYIEDLFALAGVAHAATEDPDAVGGVEASLQRHLRLLRRLGEHQHQVHHLSISLCTRRPRN